MNAGAVHARDIDAFPRVAITSVGAPGTVNGITKDVEADLGPFPAAFTAYTPKEYAEPLVRPVTALPDVIAAGVDNVDDPDTEYSY